FLERVVVVSGDRRDLGVGHGDLRVERGELLMLLVLLRAVMTAREREDQRIIALQRAELARRRGVIGQLVVGKNGAGHHVGTHGLPPSSWRSRQPRQSLPDSRRRRPHGTAQTPSGSLL